MIKDDIFPYYKRCVDYYDMVYNALKSQMSREQFEELFTIRGYFGDEQRKLLRKMRMGYCNIDDASVLGSDRNEFGLVSSKDNFLLDGRFIIPVHDIAGNIVSLIGYYPDYKKYITCPSPFFSKDCMFFNFKGAYDLSWREYGGYVILVEGIFDCLSLKSIGLPAIATMGSNVSKTKGELLRFFSKVLGIPDDDKTGHAALNRYSRSGWKVPSNTTMLKFKGGTFDANGTKLHCKDMDNFVSWYEADDVREILLSYRDCKEDIVEFSIE